ncbi:MAG: class II fructose-bisphosphatase [Rickettsiaceae bacterium]|nr:MAG: class II fructose-bisphosphatase [Rickettsiaceae bacterium]
MQHIKLLDSDLVLEILNVCEQAAIACFPLKGKGDEQEADKIAVDAMRNVLNKINVKGKIVIGEGERDQAPMLYIGEIVGCGQHLELDIAVDPLEGTKILASGRENAMTVIAVANSGSMLEAPDVYMEKIVIGVDFPEQIIDLNNSPRVNLANIAKAKQMLISDLTVAILDRPRHEELIARVREVGAKVNLIDDGDIAASIITTMPKFNIDVYMGTGGAPEGVLAAAALRSLGGQMHTRLLFNTEEEKKHAATMGIIDFNKTYNLRELVKGNVIFAATGVTDGKILKGVQLIDSKFITNSIITYSSDHSIRRIERIHSFNNTKRISNL